MGTLVARYGLGGNQLATNEGLIRGGSVFGNGPVQMSSVGGQLVQASPYAGQVVVAPGGGSATVQPGLILPGNPAQSVTVNPSTQVNTNRLAEFDLTTLLPAAGSFFEAQLGAVYDMLDVSTAALTIDLIDVLTPDGQVQDILFLTRVKTVERFITQIPAGIWRFMNVSGAAIAAAKKIGISHMAPRNQLVM